MKHKFSNSQEIHEFFLSQIKKIVGRYGKVEVKYELFHYEIYAAGEDQCLWEPTLHALFTFFSKYRFHYYINFEYSKLRAYIGESTLKELETL